MKKLIIRGINNQSLEKGITLISLVTTIIILLILAGVSISLISGSHGILGKATTSVDKTNIETAKEQVSLKIAEYQSDFYEGKYVTQEIEKEQAQGTWIYQNYVGKTADYEFTITLPENGEVNEKNPYIVTISKNSKLPGKVTGTLSINGILNWNENKDSNQEEPKEEASHNSIIGKIFTADFRNTLNDYACTSGEAKTDETLGLVPEKWDATGEVWNYCCYEKTSDIPFHLSEPFEIAIEYQLGKFSSAYDMGGLILQLQQSNENNTYEDSIGIGIADAWEAYDSVWVTMIANTQTVYNTAVVQPKYNIKMIGDGTNINFYINEQLVATTKQEENKFFDKVVIKFEQYPGHGVGNINHLESIYFGDIRK